MTVPFVSFGVAPIGEIRLDLGSGEQVGDLPFAIILTPIALMFLDKKELWTSRLEGKKKMIFLGNFSKFKLPQIHFILHDNTYKVIYYCRVLVSNRLKASVPFFPPELFLSSEEFAFFLEVASLMEPKKESPTNKERLVRWPWDTNHWKKIKAKLEKKISTPKELDVSFYFRLSKENFGSLCKFRKGNRRIQLLFNLLSRS